MAAELSTGKEPVVRLGDLVTVRCDEAQMVRQGDPDKGFSFSGYMFADGLAQDRFGLQRVKGQQPPPDVRGCLFAVTMQHQYQMRKELQSAEALMKTKKSVDKDRIHHLKENLAREELMNKKRSEERIGEQVNYGDVIQLRHIRSQRFITVQPRELADKDAQAFKIDLEGEGSDKAWFKIMPRYKVRRVGDPIMYGDKITFVSAQIGGALTATKLVLDGTDGICEVNCTSRSNTAWNMEMFSAGHKTDPQEESAAQHCIKFQNVVRLFHSETDGFLSNALPSPVPPEERPARRTAVQAQHARRRREGKQPRWADRTLKVEGADKPTPVEEEFEREDLDGGPTGISSVWKGKSAVQARELTPEEVAIKVYLYRPRANLELGKSAVDAMVQSLSLWWIESARPLEGGDLTWGASVRFRSVLTGRYLSIAYEDPVKRSGKLMTIATMQRDDPATEFVVVSTQPGQTGPVSYSNTCKLYNPVHRLTLHAHGEYTSSPYLNMGVGEELGDTDLAQLGQDEAAYTMTAVPTQYTSDLEFMISLCEAVTIYYKDLKAGNMSAEHARLTQQVLTDAIFFLTVTEDDNPLTCEGTPITSRQDLTRETCLIELLFLCLQEHMRHGESKVLEPTAQHTCRLLYKLLRHCFVGNHTNELYVVKNGFLLLMVGQVGLDLGASDAVSDLLKNNKLLLEDEVDPELIELFIGIILKRGRNATYLRLLMSLCECNSRAISSNQEDVLRLLLLDKRRRGLLLRLRLDGKAQPVDKKTLERINSASSVLGKNIGDKGFQTVMVAWDMDVWDNNNAPPAESNLSCRELFDAQEVSLEELCATPHPSDKYGKQKVQLAEFLIAQLRLMANLCLERSCNAIEVLSTMLPFELLLSIMRNTRLPPAVRYAAVRAMTNLWINRNPQHKLPVPQYTRVFQATQTAAPPPSVPAAEDPNVLALLIDFGMEYIHDTEGKMVLKQADMNKLTLAVLWMLRFLLMFGYFGKVADVEQLVKPLILLLNGVTDLETAPERSSDNAAGVGTPELATPSSIQHKSFRGNVNGPSRSRSNKVSPVALVKPHEKTAAWANAEANKPGNSNWRYAKTENSMWLMQCRHAICDILLRIYDSATDYRISHLLSVYAATRSNEIGPPNDTIGGRMNAVVERFKRTATTGMTTAHVDEIMNSATSRQLDCGAMSQDTLIPILFDLLLYDSPTLLDKTLELLRVHFSQRQALLEQALKVQLLVDDASKAMNAKLTADISTLRVHLESFEIWGMLGATDLGQTTRQVAQANYQDVISLIVSLTAGCYRESEDAPTRGQRVATLRGAGASARAIAGPASESESDLSDSDVDKSPKIPLRQRRGSVTMFSSRRQENREVHREYQNMLRNGGIIDVILLCLEIDLPPDPSMMDSRLRDLMRACYGLIVAFTRDNETNQEALAAFISEFLEHLNMGVGAAEAVAAIFDNNSKLCATISPAMVRHIVDLNEDAGASVEYLDILQRMVVSEGQPVRAAQEMVLHAITDPALSRTLVLCVKGDEFEMRAKWSSNAASEKEKLALDYHIGLIELLAMCSLGRTRFAEAKCQHLYPLDALLKGILDKRTTEPLRVTLVNFLYHVYINAEVHSSGTAHQELLWEVFRTFQKHIAAVDSRSHLRQLDFVFESILPLITVFYLAFYHGEEASVTHAAVTSDLLKALRMLSTLPELPAARKRKITTCLAAMEPTGEAAEEAARSKDQDAGGGVGLNATATAVVMPRSVPDHFLATVTALLENSVTQQAIDDEMWQFVVQLRALKGVNVTYEAVIQRFITHASTHVTNEHVQNNITILRLLTMIVMRGESLPKEDDYAMEKMQTELARFGAHALVLRVVAESDVPECTMAAFELGIALLQGGNTVVQNAMHTILDEETDSFFFSRVSRWLGKCQEALHLKRSIIEESDIALTEEEQKSLLSSTDEALVNGTSRLLRFLQLMAEGHNAQMQSLIRAQPKAVFQVDVLGDVVGLLGEVEGRLTDELALCRQIFAALVEFTQGPCQESQEHLAETELILICNRVLSTTAFEKGVSVLEEHGIKNEIIKLLLALLERRGDTNLHQQITATLDPFQLRRELILVHGRQEDKGNKLLSLLAKEAKPSEEREILTQESFNIVMLMGALADHNPNFAANMDPNKLERRERKKYRPAFNAISEKMGTVEIVWNDKLELVYFPLPRYSDKLNDVIKDQLVWSVDRTSPESKIKDFIERSDAVHEQFQQFEHLSGSLWYRMLNKIGLQNWRWFYAIIATVINLFLVSILIAPDVPSDTGETYPDPAILNLPDGQLAFRILGAIQIVVCVFIAAMIACTDGHLNMVGKRQKAMEKQRAERAAMEANNDDDPADDAAIDRMAAQAVRNAALKAQEVALMTFYNGPARLWYQFTEPMTLWYMAMLVFAILGIVGYYYFFSFLLLDIVTRSERLRNVTRAVTTTWIQLLLTALLSVIVLYVFAFFSFVYLRAMHQNGDSGTYECQTLIMCFVTYLDVGFRSGGGIGDAMTRQEVLSANWVGSIIFKLAFYVAIPLVTVNLVLGIIIDAFGSQREDYNKKLDDMTNCCFICSLPRDIIDRHGNGFLAHTKKEHSMWQYLFFIIFLKEKDSTEYNGMEQYIRGMLDNEDTSWIPSARALHVNEQAGEGEEKAEQEMILMGAMRAQIDELRREMQHNMSAMRHMLANSERASSSGGSPAVRGRTFDEDLSRSGRLSTNRSDRDRGNDREHDR